MYWKSMVFSLSLGCVSGQLRTEITAALSAPQRPAGYTPFEPTHLAELTRSELISLALSNDPGVRARGLRARSLAHAARAESSRPAPEIGAQIWNLPLARPWSLGEADMYMFELRGSIPPAGALSGRARASLSEAREALGDIADRERTLARRVSGAHAACIASSQRLDVHQRHIAQMEAMIEAARARYEASNASLAELSRATVERAMLQRRIARDQGELSRARQSLNVLLRRAPEAPLALARDDSSGVVDITLQALILRAEARPEALRARERGRAQGARADAFHAESVWPTFTLGGSYWQAPGERPGLGATASMTLPWLSGASSAREREAREMVLSEREAEREAVLDGGVEITSAYGHMQAVATELLSLRAQGREASHQLVEAARSVYLSGRSDLVTWIDAARAALDVETEEIELSQELADAVSDLEWSVGAPLPRRALHSDGASQ